MAEAKNIFLVDDDSTFMFLTKKLIMSSKADTLINEFSDGQKALDYLKGHLNDQEQYQYPDLILLDLSMPVVDGWGFLEEYISFEKQIKKKIRLYIVSSSISPHDIERARTYKIVSDFIIKPLLREKFLEIIDSLYNDDISQRLII